MNAVLGNVDSGCRFLRTDVLVVIQFYVHVFRVKLLWGLRGTVRARQQRDTHDLRKPQQA